MGKRGWCLLRITVTQHKSSDKGNSNERSTQSDLKVKRKLREKNKRNKKRQHGICYREREGRDKNTEIESTPRELKDGWLLFQKASLEHLGLNFTTSKLIESVDV